MELQERMESAEGRRRAATDGEDRSNQEVKTHFEDGSNLALSRTAGLPVLSAIFRSAPDLAIA